MKKEQGLYITSEVGKLKKVMLHRPGKELERITPGRLESLLFEDIPWLKQMQKEHDDFAKVLEEHGCQVYYYEQLLQDILKESKVKKNLIEDVVTHCGIEDNEIEACIKDFLNHQPIESVVEVCIAGLSKKEIPYNRKQKRLVDYIKEDDPFYIHPLPNLYFTRDPGAVIGKGLSIHNMKTWTRKREAGLLKYIYEYHPEFKKEETPLWYDPQKKHAIEGGDVLVLGKDCVAIGCSQRTSSRAIENLAIELFENHPSIQQVIAVEIPMIRAYMHLDTVLTMVNYDQFTIYPGVQNQMKAYILTKGETYPKVESMPNLKKAFEKVLHIQGVEFIQSGGNDEVTAAREQWNDSTNTLAIAPGVVITYDRNEASNETLRKHGIEVVNIKGSELVRGRGGPRCMSMPLYRED